MSISIGNNMEISNLNLLLKIDLRQLGGGIKRVHVNSFLNFKIDETPKKNRWRAQNGSDNNTKMRTKDNNLELQQKS